MKFRQDGYNWLVRFERGEEVVAGLVELVRQEKLPNVWVSGLGGAQSVTLGFYQLDKKEYAWQKFDELLEVTSLQGNIVGTVEEPVLHIHGTLSRPDMSAIGGHIKELIVGGTCELLLHRWYGEPLTRTQNEAVGLKLLDL